VWAKVKGAPTKGPLYGVAEEAPKKGPEEEAPLGVADEGPIKIEK